MLDSPEYLTLGEGLAGQGAMGRIVKLLALYRGSTEPLWTLKVQSGSARNRYRAALHAIGTELWLLMFVNVLSYLNINKKLSSLIREEGCNGAERLCTESLLLLMFINGLAYLNIKRGTEMGN